MASSWSVRTMSVERGCRRTRIWGKACLRKKHTQIKLYERIYQCCLGELWVMSCGSFWGAFESFSGKSLWIQHLIIRWAPKFHDITSVSQNLHGNSHLFDIFPGTEAPCFSSESPAAPHTRSRRAVVEHSGVKRTVGLELDWLMRCVNIWL